MSRRGDVTVRCWDGEYTFRLGIGELITLQEKCDAGPLHIAMRLAEKTWRVQDVRETLRLGLIGAGMDQEKARALIEQHVDRVPLLDNIHNAQAVILGAVAGVEESLGEPLAKPSDPFHGASSASPDITQPGS